VTKPGRGEATVTLKIPRPLYERLKQVIEGTGFHSVTEFVVYVLRDLAVERSTRPFSHPEQVEPLSPDEIEAVRRRLESLGYL
jgi:hypothetical protein